MQFLSPSTNRRTGAYGGSRLARLRFVIEVVEAIGAAIGKARVGIRICPGGTYNDIQDDDPGATYRQLGSALNALDPAYLHVVRSPDVELDAFAIARQAFHGSIIVNDEFHRESGMQALADGSGDAVSYARHFIANPDLVERFRLRAPLATFDRRTLYTAGPKGYTDYPVLAAVGAAT